MQVYAQGVIRALGLQKLGSLIALACAYLVQIPSAILFAFYFDMGVAGLFWACGLGMACQVFMFFTLIL